MTIAKRKTFIKWTSVAFLIGCLIFLAWGMLGFRFVYHKCVDMPWYHWIIELVQTTIFGGYLLGSAVAGMICVRRFLKGKSKWLAVLTITSILLLVYVEKLLYLCLFLLNVTYLYNLICVLRKD